MVISNKWDDNYKQYAIDAAKDLCYKDEVIWALEQAKTEAEVCKIMTDVRTEGYVYSFN